MMSSFAPSMRSSDPLRPRDTPFSLSLYHPFCSVDIVKDQLEELSSILSRCSRDPSLVRDAMRKYTSNPVTDASCIAFRDALVEACGTTAVVDAIRVVIPDIEERKKNFVTETCKEKPNMSVLVHAMVCKTYLPCSTECLKGRIVFSSIKSHAESSVKSKECTSSCTKCRIWCSLRGAFRKMTRGEEDPFMEELLEREKEGTVLSPHSCAYDCISGEVMQNPVCNTVCGHRFDKQVIKKWTKGRTARCPLCNEIFSEGFLKRDDKVASILQSAIRKEEEVCLRRSKRLKKERAY